MEIYDAVAPAYSDVFDRVELRRFEWPWLKRLIHRLKPRRLLDLGCGNGYLITALKPMVPELTAIEPSGAMFRAARERLGGEAALYLAGAEALPFGDEYFDTAISLLSFRYMNWERALPEIHRVLKPEGVFILIDLFDARFSPLQLGNYGITWIKTRLQYAANQDFRRRLKGLAQNRAWQTMVQEHPKRNLDEAKHAIQKHFLIDTEKNLSRSVRGKTTGLVCRKK